MAAREIERSHAEQIAARRVLDLKPLPTMAVRPFRAWLKLEQASLFVSNDYDAESFTYSQEITHPDTKEKGLKRVTVGKVDRKGKRKFGVLRQIHQEVYHRLLELWGEDGHPIMPAKDPRRAFGHLLRSGYAVVTAIGGRLVVTRDPDGDLHRVREANASGKEYVRVRELVRELASIPIVFEVQWVSGRVERCEFTLLQGVTWTSKTEGDQETSEVSILFSDVVTRGFFDKELKVMLAQPYEQIGALDAAKPEGKRRRGGNNRDAMAKLLYRHLEGHLANKDTYHISLDSLAERLGFARYRFFSDRTRKMRPAVARLDSLRLPILPGSRKGYVLRVGMEEGAERQGVLVARREQADPDSQLALFDFA